MSVVLRNCAFCFSQSIESCQFREFLALLRLSYAMLKMCRYFPKKGNLYGQWVSLWDELKHHRKLKTLKIYHYSVLHKIPSEIIRATQNTLRNYQCYTKHPQKLSVLHKTPSEIICATQNTLRNPCYTKHPQKLSVLHKTQQNFPTH